MMLMKTPRSATGVIALAILIALFAMNLTGCSDSDTSPTAVVEQPPVMPAAEQLQFDFSFFDDGATLQKSDGVYDNFINAYVRVAVLDLMAKLVLVAPVSAFSAALHTVPMAMDDGSWVWTYVWQHPDGPVNIVLSGLPAGDVVDWEMRLVPGGFGDGVVWFTGSTNGNADEGHWTFYDLDLPEHPVSGEIAWGDSDGGRFLEFVCHEPESDGDTLRFNDNHPDYSIDFTPGDGSAASFIRWNAAGAGSLMVPDYNDGAEACWGVNLQNADCD